MSTYLQNVSDQELFQETAKRLKDGFKSRYRTECRYGSFNFIFYNGRFVGIEENLKHRPFWIQAGSHAHQQGVKS